MLRHVAVFVFTPEFEADGLDHWMQRVRELAFVVPGVRMLSVGRDVVDNDGPWQVALVADFDDRAALERYNAHPAHQAVLAISGPARVQRAIVDFEI
jgi:uncharacterized protein (DUF1330 family)